MLYTKHQCMGIKIYTLKLGRRKLFSEKGQNIWGYCNGGRSFIFPIFCKGGDQICFTYSTCKLRDPSCQLIITCNKFGFTVQYVSCSHFYIFYSNCDKSKKIEYTDNIVTINNRTQTYGKIHTVGLSREICHIFWLVELRDQYNSRTLSTQFEHCNPRIIGFFTAAIFHNLR